MSQKIRKYLCYYRKEVSIGLACFCVFLLSLILLLPKSKASSGTTEEPIVTDPMIELEPVTPDPVLDTIRVDIKGAVATPGVYEMREGTRVADVIYQAGGVLENADLSRINLSKRVLDEMVIIIYTKEEIAAYQAAQTKIEYVYLEPDCNCPDTVNDACITQQPTDTSTSDKISLNTATQEELETLPGIGESKAKIIMEYRDQKRFESIEELKEIKGIGEKIFEKLKDYITL